MHQTDSEDSVRPLPLTPFLEADVRVAAFWADLRPGYNIPRNVPQLHAAAAQTEAAAQMPTTRRMKETFVEFELPFESDKSLLEIYGGSSAISGGVDRSDAETQAGAHNSIRLGRLMEGESSLRRRGRAG